MWGIFVLVPLLRSFESWLGGFAGNFPLFSGPPMGIGILAAGVILAIMILPYITSVSREVIKTVPLVQREAAYALGATRWEVIRGPILRYVRSGILGAIILGLGRALGETMAVTMVIGNVAVISASLFSQGYTMPSLLANEYNEATEKLHISALVEVALVLVIITIIVNGIARLLIWSVARNDRQGTQ
jgi:phosphate transport system permease protein